MRCIPLTLALAVVLAAPAAAADLHVATGGAGTACTAAAPCATITAAVTAGRATPEPDVVHVGPGVFPGSVELTSADDGLVLRGTDDDTFLTAASTVALQVGADDVTVERLRIHNEGVFDADRGERRGAGVYGNGTGLRLLDSEVRLSSEGDQDQVLHLRADDARVERSVIVRDGGAHAVYADGGSDVTFVASAVEGGFDVRGNEAGSLELVRSTVRVPPAAEAAVSVDGPLRADSTLITGATFGVRQWGAAGPAAEPDAVLRNVTIDAKTPGVRDGGLASSVIAQGARVVVTSSILFEPATTASDDGLFCDHTNLAPGSSVGEGATVACGPQGANTSTDPTRLVSAQYLPQGEALDTGDLGTDGSPFDPLGLPRVQDGDGDGVARRDRGAYERPAPVPVHGGGGPAPQPQPQPSPPVLPGPGPRAVAPPPARLLRGMKLTRRGRTATITFTLAADATVTATARRGRATRRVTRRLRAGRRSLRVGGLGRGRWKLTLTARAPGAKPVTATAGTVRVRM